MSRSDVALELFDPRGRCNRKGLLIIAVVLLALQAAAGAAMWLGLVQHGGPAARIAEAVFVLLAFTATSKRLHDMGLSAWWILAAFAGMSAWSAVLAMALVLTVGAAALQPGSAAFMVAVVGVMIPAFVATLWLHLKKGDASPNRFGPEPGALGFSIRREDEVKPRFGTPIGSARA